MEQLLLKKAYIPYLVYDENYFCIAPKKMPTAFVYTMNVPENLMEQVGYPKTFNHIESPIESIFTKPLVMYSNDTYQFYDYSKYESSAFSEEAKVEHRKTQFPLDCQKAFELGANLIK